MKKVVVSGYYGFDNIGDDSMIETFSKYFKQNDIQAVFMSKNPNKTKKTFDVEAISRDNVFEIIKTIKKSDILISGGGTLLQDITKIISIWYYLFIILLGIMFKKEVYILFQGIGPINNKFNIWLTKKILSKVDYIILRDQKAYDEMIKLELDTSRTKVVTDTVFALAIPDEKKNIDLMKKYIKDFNINNTYISVCLRPWKNIRNEVDFARTLDEIAKKHDAQIIFFPFHKGQDYEFSNRIIEKMDTKCHLLYDDFVPSQMAGLMSLMKLNIGVRLHSLVFSIIVGVPTIGITYDPKVDGFLNEIGMKPVCEYADIDKEKILSEVDKIFEDKYDKNIFLKTEENRKKVIKILDDVIGGKYAKN